MSVKTRLLRARLQLDAALAELEPAPPMTLALGPMVRARREALEMSLQDLADASGVSKPHIWTLEQESSTNPGVDTVVALARALGLDPVELFRSAVKEARDVLRIGKRPSISKQTWASGGEK